MLAAERDGHARREWDAAVGQLLSAAADAECRLAALLRILAGIDGPGAAHVLPREVPAMAALAEDLLPVHVRDRRLHDDFRRWVQAVARLCALRVTVVHSVWELRAEGHEPVMHPAWSSSDAGRSPMTPGELARTTYAATKPLGRPADELLLRLDKAVPELAVFSRR